MTTRTPDPFTPHGTLGREDLMAYVEGRLDPRAAHEVESHLEADPLLREAVEGLQLPGAMAGLSRLPAQAPGTGHGPWLSLMVALAVVVVVATLVALYMDNDAPAPTVDAIATPEAATHTVAPSDTLTGQGDLGITEIMASEELPESLHIGHATTERHSIAQVHTATTPSPVERTTLDPVRPLAPRMATDTAHKAPPTAHGHRSSLQLVYLHDLKLLHPKELYGRSPDITRITSGVDARYIDAQAQEVAASEERRIGYLAFMDEALGRFARHDHKGCLEELRYVLKQYPEDVNALFYAGLCCYNLGMDQRAEQYLRQAAEHRFRVFDEEATWYHALTLDHLGQRAQARNAFERIVHANGFYADRARTKLER